jgi:hypothetical protein
MMLVIVGLVVLLGGGGAAAFGLGLVGGDGSGGSEPAAAEGAKPEGRSGGRVKVGPVEAGRGTVILRVRPPGQSVVRVTAVSGDYKETWNSEGALELVGLPAGKYKTKVTPAGGGGSARATFEVKDGEACELTFDSNQGGDWSVGKCGPAR